MKMNPLVSRFGDLTKEEQDLMFSAPALVSILIAGADDNIKDIHLKVASELAVYKSKTIEPYLRRYFEIASADIEDKINELIAKLPGKASHRNPLIIEDLKRVNNIIQRINFEFADKFYFALKDIARCVAEASGGILGYMSINKEEAEALNNLKMILRPTPEPDNKSQEA